MLFGFMLANSCQLNIAANVIVDPPTERRHRGVLIKRKRIKVDEMEKQLGPYYFRRSYRMPADKFRKLLSLVKSHIHIGR